MRVEVSLGSVALVLGGLALAFLAAGIVVSAQRVFTWVVASAVAAALVEILVGWLDRWMQRALAIILVLLILAASAGLLTFGVLRALDREVARLQQAVPAAASDIEQNSERFGKAATEIDLEKRVQQAVDRMRSPSSGLAGQAVSSVGTYTVCAILTILFLSWAPKVFTAALERIGEVRRRRARAIASSAFTRSRRYVMLSIAQSTLVGLLGYTTARLADLPAAAPLALALAVFGLVPNIGILVGSLPMLLLAIALAPSRTAIACTVFFVALQLASTFFVQKRIVRASNLYVGPAVIAISFLAGFELYGIGGAGYAAAISVLAVAAIDSNAEETEHELSETERILSAH